MEAEESVLARLPSMPRRRLTVDEYYRMGEAGILTRDDRVELIEGELVAMSPIGSDHSDTSNTLTRTLVMAVGDRGVVSVQTPIRLNRFNEPQPDFLVLRLRPGGYRAAHPGPADVILAIEVSASSLRYDRGVKRALYARHGIQEFWIVDLDGRAVEVGREPSGDGYAVVERVGADGTLTLPELEVSFAAAPLFGPP